jgi:hypothetical protein
MLSIPACQAAPEGGHGRRGPPWKRVLVLVGDLNLQVMKEMALRPQDSSECVGTACRWLYLCLRFKGDP